MSTHFFKKCDLLIDKKLTVNLFKQSMKMKKINQKFNPDEKFEIKSIMDTKAK